MGFARGLQRGDAARFASCRAAFHQTASGRGLSSSPGGAGAGETDEIFRIAGLMDVVQSEGAEFFDHNRPTFPGGEARVRTGEGCRRTTASVMVNPRVLEYETLITLNQLKVHETATVTLSLKNIAMSYPAADYYGHPRGDERQHDFLPTCTHSSPPWRSAFQRSSRLPWVIRR
jgi:uncharacterized protein (DUF362 family)